MPGAGRVLRAVAVTWLSLNTTCTTAFSAQGPGRRVVQLTSANSGVCARSPYSATPVRSYASGAGRQEVDGAVLVGAGGESGGGQGSVCGGEGGAEDSGGPAVVGGAGEHVVTVGDGDTSPGASPDNRSSCVWCWGVGYAAVS